eukprot:CAMPEP_0118664412 /NCGR_PEP_ID=MMETSP0785-20121206/17998_1 /TAXON_ID=91992 /ORGANISM="Bolidomonas pacifica, Strain CCMP 1866" /LENGTH=356 /DNA_ID=CAMNT_0006558315 /DNA_START=138 /DNA_END=1205 /DNA_ORIENTATION=-
MTKKIKIDEPHIQLTPLQVSLLDLLRRVRSKGDAFGFFSRPVDPVKDDCPDYYDTIPKEDAMDLGTIEAMIREGNVAGGDDFVRLITKVVTNALTYNTDTSHVVHQEALILRKVLTEEHEKVKKRLDHVEGKKVNYSESDRKFWRDQHERVEEEGEEEVKKRNERIALLTGITASSSTASVASDSKSKSSRSTITSAMAAATSPMNPSGKKNGGSKNADRSVFQYQYTDRDAEIPGAAIPHCDRDLKGSTINFEDSRSTWLKEVENMVTVCNEAARRRTLSQSSGRATRYDKPLSDDYIRERLELDDPLQGYVVRDKSSGEMQGFIVVTNFTTWRTSFIWDSLLPQAGITQSDRAQ